MSAMRGKGMEGQAQNDMIIDMPSTQVNETLTTSPPPYDATQLTLPQYTSSQSISDADAISSRLIADEKTRYFQHQFSASDQDSDDGEIIISPYYQSLQVENNTLRNHNTALRAILFPSLIILIALFTCFVFVNASVLRSRRLLEMEMLQEIVVLRKELGEARAILKAFGS